MYVTKDKKTAINTDLVQTVSVTPADSVILSLGANSVTLDGDDAEAVAKEFGLTSHADDAAAKEKKEAAQHPAPPAAKK